MQQSDPKVSVLDVGELVAQAEIDFFCLSIEQGSRPVDRGRVEAGTKGDLDRWVDTKSWRLPTGTREADESVLKRLRRRLRASEQSTNS